MNRDVMVQSYGDHAPRDPCGLAEGKLALTIDHEGGQEAPNGGTAEAGRLHWGINTLGVLLVSCTPLLRTHDWTTPPFSSSTSMSYQTRPLPDDLIEVPQLTGNEAVSASLLHFPGLPARGCCTRPYP